jgi:hypothetical protein
MTSVAFRTRHSVSAREPSPHGHPADRVRSRTKRAHVTAGVVRAGCAGPNGAGQSRARLLAAGLRRAAHRPQANAAGPDGPSSERKLRELARRRRCVCCHRRAPGDLPTHQNRDSPEPGQTRLAKELGCSRQLVVYWAGELGCSRQLIVGCRRRHARALPVRRQAGRAGSCAGDDGGRCLSGGLPVTAHRNDEHRHSHITT